MLSKKTVDDLKDLQSKKVLVHCNFNVPLREGVTQNYGRIDGAIPTIRKPLDQGAKVVLCSHLGKPGDEPVPKMSLVPVTLALSEGLGVEVKFADDPRVTGSEARKVAAELKDGKVLLLQNARCRGEETKFKDGDAASEACVEKPADLCDDIFVNDASGTAHKVRCSNVGVTRFIKENVVDYLMEEEIKLLGQAVENPARPLVAVLGGTKISDKINVINNLLDKVDTLITGSGMAYTFVKARGQKIGDFLCEADKLNYALGMIKKAEEKDVKLLLPVDRVEGKEFSDDTEHKVVDVTDAGWSGFDTGPKTVALYKETLQSAKTIVRDGSMDVFKFSNLAEGTLGVCRAVADLADATTVIGGGDSVNAVEKLGFADRMTHISVDGGTPLEFLESKELPSVAAADNRV